VNQAGSREGFETGPNVLYQGLWIRVPVDVSEGDDNDDFVRDQSSMSTPAAGISRRRDVNEQLVTEASAEVARKIAAGETPDASSPVLKYSRENTLCGSCPRIVLPAGVTRIPDWAFYNCHVLVDITLPPSVTEIGSSAFQLCRSLKSVTFSAGLPGLTKIGSGAFYQCPNLSEIALPATVVDMGAEAFRDCPALATVTLSDGLTAISKGTFNDCKALEAIAIPEGVTRIAFNAFYKCDKLASVALPASVVEITDCAFDGCPLDASSRAKILAVNERAIGNTTPGAVYDLSPNFTMDHDEYMRMNR